MSLICLDFVHWNGYRRFARMLLIGMDIVFLLVSCHFAEMALNYMYLRVCSQSPQFVPTPNGSNRVFKPTHVAPTVAQVIASVRDLHSVYVHHVGMQEQFGCGKGLHLLQCYNDSYGLRYHTDRERHAGSFPPQGSMREGISDEQKVRILLFCVDVDDLRG